MRHTGMNKLAPLAAALLVLTAACGSADSNDSDTAADDASAAAGSQVAIDDLDGKAFVADEADELDSAKQSLAAGSQIVVQFEDGNLSASAGCNGLGSKAEIVDGTLETDQLYGTEMACADDVMAQEQWLTKFLMSSPEIALDGDTLTLTSGDESLVLVGGEAVDDGGTAPGDDGVTSKN